MFWGNEQSALNPKPKIEIQKEKDPFFSKTEIHFDELFKKYGDKIFVLNLVKTIKSVEEPSNRSKEFELGNLFTKVVTDLSQKYFQKEVTLIRICLLNTNGMIFLFRIQKIKNNY